MWINRIITTLMWITRLSHNHHSCHVNHQNHHSSNVNHKAVTQASQVNKCHVNSLKLACKIAQNANRTFYYWRPDIHCVWRSRRCAVEPPELSQCHLCWWKHNIKSMTNKKHRNVQVLTTFYRAMHFSAKCGIAIACRLSVRLSVCLSVTLVNCDHIG